MTRHAIPKGDRIPWRDLRNNRVRRGKGGERESAAQERTHSSELFAKRMPVAPRNQAAGKCEPTLKPEKTCAGWTSQEGISTRAISVTRPCRRYDSRHHLPKVAAHFQPSRSPAPKIWMTCPADLPSGVLPRRCQHAEYAGKRKTARIFVVHPRTAEVKQEETWQIDFATRALSSGTQCRINQRVVEEGEEANRGRDCVSSARSEGGVWNRMKRKQRTAALPLG